jgi:hypothetical protein
MSPSVTISRFSFGISMPMTDLPGITSTTRTLIADSERARSFASALIWLTLTPGAGRISKRVTTGPGSTATTSTSTPKSLSLSSTRRDMASSASAEYSDSRCGESSSSDSGGSSPALASNNGACRSFSTRSLFSMTGAGASMRGLARAADFLCSTSTTSLRACLRVSPSATSRATARLALKRSIAFQNAAPVRSMMVSHETPKASEMPPIHAASISSVPPRKLKLDSMASPNSMPTTPPADCRSEPALQCSQASAQLAISTTTKPPTRSIELVRDAPSSAARRRSSVQHHAPSITGNRNAGQPNRKNSTSANQAPKRPIRLWT